MNQTYRYICLIRREEFNDLIRFGMLDIRPNSVLSVDSDFEHLKGESELYLKSLAYISNRFDESSSYIGIYFEKDCRYEELVNVSDVKRIFALDEQSYNDFTLSFDRNINLLPPIWDDMFSRIQIEQEACNRREGSNILWKTYKIEFPIEEIQDIVSDEAIKEFIEVSYCGTIFGQSRSMLTHLLKYTRHGFYGKENIGFFKDTVNIFLNCKRQIEALEEEASCTDIFQMLESIRPNEVFGEIYAQIKDTSFAGQYNNAENSIDNFLLVSVLFLKFRNLYLSDMFDKKVIAVSLSNYGRDAAQAIYLLGLWLGPYKQIPSLLETYKPEFFKTENQLRLLRIQEEEARSKARREMELMEHQRELEADKRRREKESGKSRRYGYGKSNSYSLFSSDTDIPPARFPVKMAKYTKAGKPAKKPHPQVAYTQEEYDELLRQNYRPIEN